MRYHYEKPANFGRPFGEIYTCNHPVYSKCMLYVIGSKGLAVIQQRYDSNTKHTYWTEIDSWIDNHIYVHPRFKKYFDTHAAEPENGLYPTVTVRQIMWALRMKPLPKEQWETVFDRPQI